MVQRLPRIELADLLIEVDRWTGFTKHFTHAGGAKPRNPDLTRHLYATILAQACNFGLTTMAEVSDLSYRQLAWTTDWYLREETLKAAFSSLVDYQHCLPLAQAWGRGGPIVLRWPAIPSARKSRERDGPSQILRPGERADFLHLDLGPVLPVWLQGHLLDRARCHLHPR